MRIRFFSYFYPPCIGGGEVILQHQAEELARRGHDVHVHTTPYTNINLSTRTHTGVTVENGVHVYRHPSAVLHFHNPLEKDAITPGLWRAAWLPADLLVCVGFPSLHLDALVPRSRATNVPLVVQNYITADFLHEILSGEGGFNKRVRAAYWRSWVRPMLERASLIIADSPAAGQALSRTLKLGNVQTHIGMAVDPREFELDPKDGAAIRAKLGLGDAKVILAPSRLSKQKGADLLVQALGPTLPSGWRLVIAGPVNEADFAASVQAMAPAGTVFTQLPRLELCALMLESDIVVLPSRGETVGGVVFEGMYAGALCIVSDAVEAARDDYLQHNANGFMFPSEDVPALRAALHRAMTEDTTHLRLAGRTMVEQRFTWGRSVDRLLHLYTLARNTHATP